jgi:PAS domain S-box-containing protein
LPPPLGSREIADLENRLAEALATIDELSSGQQENSYRTIADLSPDGVMVHTDGIIQYGNASLAKLFGVATVDDLIGKEAIGFIAPEERDRVLERRKRSFEGQAVFAEEARFIRTDGSEIYLERTTSQIQWNGELSLLVMFRDVTSRRDAREAQRESEQRYRRFIENSGLGIHITKAAGGRLFVNDAMVRLLGYESLSEINNLPELTIIAPHNRELAIGKRLEALENPGSVIQYESDFQCKDGSSIPLHVLINQIEWDGEKAILRTVIDLSQRKQAEQALYDIEERFLSAIDNLTEGFALFDENEQFVFANQWYRRGFERKDGSVPSGTTFEDTVRDRIKNGYVSKDAKGREEEWIAERVTEFRNPAGPTDYRFGNFWVQSTVVKLPDGGTILLISDITARKQAEDALRESEGTLRAFTNNSPSIIYVRDTQSRIIKINKAYEDFHNITEAEAIGKTGHEWLDEKLAQQSLIGDRQVMTSGQPTTVNFEELDPDGKTHYMQAIKFPIMDEHGIVVAVGGIANDMTEHREREEQLSQAQKMDAVGQLTGGVAHDFNNLLTVVIGNIELAQERLTLGGEIAPLLDRAQDGAMRGATLTQRLLAFSRKQDLHPQDIDARQLVVGMSDLMQRALGETIEIDVIGHGSLWQCKADQSQLENALLNLAINARDAMPHGGKLTIETDNIQLDDDEALALADVKPGEYVTLAVTDTGTGMPDDVLEKVFEPFYTTKGVGAGSGLGLSMVYGFVKQSNGQVTINSEEGVGTTVTLYLPKSEITVQEDPSVAQDEPPAAGGETILVVEDDEVRALTVTLLSNLGYKIVEAVDAAAAFESLESSPEIDMLFSDVVLPGGKSGPELAAEVLQRWPGIAVLHASGYTEHAALHHGRLQDGVGLLNKPYRKVDLARMVREALDKSKL